MTGQETSTKKYIVRLNALINAGKLLKADISADGNGWDDSQIAEALDTRTDTVLRTRQRRTGLQIFAGLGPAEHLSMGLRRRN